MSRRIGVCQADIPGIADNAYTHFAVIIAGEKLVITVVIFRCGWYIEVVKVTVLSGYVIE